MEGAFLGEGVAGRDPGVQRAERALGSEVTREWNSTPSGLGFLKAQCHAQATSVPLSMWFSLLMTFSYFFPSIQTFPSSKSRQILPLAGSLCHPTTPWWSSPSNSNHTKY